MRSGLLAGLPLAALLVVAGVAPAAVESAFADAFTWTTGVFALPWQLLAVVTVLVAIAVAVHPMGRERLGTVTRPRHHWASWLAVILCTLLAGGGVFFSAAEPLYHLATPAPGLGPIAPAGREAAVAALATSHLHWGILAWGLVGTLGAVIASRRMRAGAPPRPRILVPGVPTTGWVGDGIDAVCLLAALAGTIAPIGFLALQLADAATVLLGAPGGLATQATVLAALTVLYTASAVSGVDRGILWLSRLNVLLGLVLAGALLVLGPTAALVTLGLEAMRAYLVALPSLALDRTDPSWTGAWTVFYWGWFIGYAPLMALFLARISAGRTLRELVLTVLFAAPLVTHGWFSLVGGTGLLTELAEPGVLSGALAQRGPGAAWLAIVATLPGEVLWTPMAILLVFCFLATTADSMAFAAAGVMTDEDEPPRSLRMGVALAMGATALVLLALGEGSIDVLQQAVVVTAIPVSLIVGCWPVMVWLPTAGSNQEDP